MSDKRESSDENVDPTLGDVADSQDNEDSDVNTDLHGAAREIAEDAGGDGPAKTPAG